MPGERPTPEEAMPEEVKMTPELEEALEQNTSAWLDAMERRIEGKHGLPQEVKPQNAVESYAMIATICAMEADEALRLNGHVENLHREELPADEQASIRDLYEAGGILTEIETQARHRLSVSYQPETDILAKHLKGVYEIEVGKPSAHNSLRASLEKYRGLIGSGRWGRVTTPIRAEDLLAYQALKDGEYRNPQDIIYGRE